MVWATTCAISIWNSSRSFFLDVCAQSPTNNTSHTNIPKVYIDENIYLLTIGLVKISILFFYLRVFPKKSFRVLCWLMIAFCTANMLAFVLVTIFQCRPISFAWARTSIREGSCVNYNAAAWANAGVNILQDFLIVVLPLQELRSLQLSKLKKFGVYAMFGMGSL
jgi:hypothetical protein